MAECYVHAMCVRFIRKDLTRARHDEHKTQFPTHTHTQITEKEHGKSSAKIKAKQKID